MLQMKKHTRAKIATLGASGLALASVLGLVHESLPNAKADAQRSVSVAPALVAPAGVSSTMRTSTAAVTSPATAAASAAAASVQAAPTMAVTRTRVS